MNSLYFQFMQTVAQFIVQAIRIDGNKDGKISRTEISTFFFAVILPLITNGNTLKNQWQGFYDFVRGMKFDDFKGVLLEIVDGQLLPGELSGVEEKVDKIALVIYNLLDAIHQTIEAYQDLFGNKKLEVRIVKKVKNK